MSVNNVYSNHTVGVVRTDFDGNTLRRPTCDEHTTSLRHELLCVYH